MAIVLSYPSVQSAAKQRNFNILKQAAIIALSLLVVGGAAWLLLNGGTSTTQQKPGAPPGQINTPLPDTPVAAETSPPETVSESVFEAHQRIRDAKLALQSAAGESKKAEAQLQQAERDVEELERFVDDIEARGEDPTDYADEGLAKFQPAFYAYQDAFDRLELAESMEQVATKELADAENHLTRILAESADK